MLHKVKSRWIIDSWNRSKIEKKSDWCEWFNENGARVLTSRKQINLEYWKKAKPSILSYNQEKKYRFATSI